MGLISWFLGVDYEKRREEFRRDVEESNREREALFRERKELLCKMGEIYRERKELLYKMGEIKKKEKETQETIIRKLALGEELTKEESDFKKIWDYKKKILAGDIKNGIADKSDDFDYSDSYDDSNYSDSNCQNYPSNSSFDNITAHRLASNIAIMSKQH